MKGKAGKKIEMGQIVTGKPAREEDYSSWIFWPVRSGDLVEPSLGIAARDIKRGEIIEWHSWENTKDVIVKGIGKA